MVAHDWNTTNDDDRSSVWFAFCDDNGVVDEIGHVGIGMQLCQADRPQRRAVMDRHTK